MMNNDLCSKSKFILSSALFLVLFSFIRVTEEEELISQQLSADRLDFMFKISLALQLPEI